MPRRSFLLGALGASRLFGETATPRNHLCNCGNEFQQPYAAWAAKMNASRDKPGTIPADAIEAFAPLPNLWRKVERAFREWVRGQ